MATAPAVTAVVRKLRRVGDNDIFDIFILSVDKASFAPGWIAS
jgi:hypothetical protein